MDKSAVYDELKRNPKNVRFNRLCGAAELFGFRFRNPKPPAKPKPLEVRELSEVYDIEFNEGEEYKYAISFFEYDPKTEERRRRKMRSKILVIAAGTLGSNELLMKCKERNHLKLSEMLGKKFFTNAIYLAS